MAKFTKLNIGDAVASSGGRVWKKLSAESAEVQDELAGTWVLNDTIDVTSFSAGTAFYLDFTVSGTSSGYEPDTISFGIFGSGARSLGVSGMDYDEGDISNITLYTNATVSGKIYWWNEAYKTITITSKLADVTNGDELLTWLKANATKIA